MCRAALSLFLLSVSCALALADRTVELDIPSNGIHLAGTLHLPDGKGPFPAIVVSGGAGPVTRADPFYSLDVPFWEKHGVAVCLYDKRGAGKSGGTFDLNEDLSVLAKDLLAAVHEVAKQHDIDPSKIVVKGISQGGWVAPLAASMSGEIAGVIVLSGPATTPAEQEIFNRGQILLEEGLPFSDMVKVSALRRTIWAYYGTGAGYQAAKDAWEAAKKEPWFAKAHLSGEVVEPDKLKDPNYNFYRRVRYDPVPAIESLKVPVVAVFGDMDRFVPVPTSVARWQAALERGRVKDGTVRIFEGAGHGINLQEDYLPIPLSHDQHEQVMKLVKLEYAKGYEDFIASWFKARF